MELVAAQTLRLNAIIQLLRVWQAEGESADAHGIEAMRLITDELALLRQCCVELDSPPEIQERLRIHLSFVDQLRLNGDFSYEYLGGPADYMSFANDDFIRTLESWIAHLRKGRRSLTPSEEVAHSAYRWAEERSGKALTDKEAYDFLCNRDYLSLDIEFNSIMPESAEEMSPAGYLIPKQKFVTWKGHLGRARKKLDDRKNSPRHRRPGRSIVHYNDLEQNRIDD